MRSLAHLLLLALSAFGFYAQATIVPKHPALNKSAADFIRYTDSYKTPQFFDENERALRARIKLLDQVPAGGTAKIMTFLFENGIATRTLVIHMCLAAKRGVNIEFIVDSKSGDRPGIDDAFDNSPDHQVNEEMFQMLANCGVQVRIHNHIPRFEDLTVAGLRIPTFNDGWYEQGGYKGPLRWMGAKARQGVGVLFKEGDAFLSINNMIGELGKVFNEEISKTREEDKAMLTELKAGLIDLLYKSLRSVVRASEEERYAILMNIAKEVQTRIKTSKLIKKVQPENVRQLLFNVLAKVQTHPVLGQFYKEARFFNRLNHRKLFWVEAQGRSCMFLGGRNLGDHYLTWGRHGDEFMDGDVLICNQHLKAGDAQVTAQAAGSFNQLWFNKDLDDPVNVKPILTIVKKNLQFKYKYLLFHEVQTQEWGNPTWVTRPYNADGSLAPMNNVMAKNSRPEGIKVQDRTMPLPITWPDVAALTGREISGSMNWRVRLSTWNRKKDEVRAELYRAIDSEQQLVYIETAYSEFSTTMRDHIEAALKRNVPVEVVTNSIYVSDAGSKGIRLVMARWTRQMLETYPTLFKIKFATIGFGHMIHFKGASFACQKANNRVFRLNLVGSHNFHGRSGYSDKEHAIIWEQLPKAACVTKLGLAKNSASSSDIDLKDMRDDFYKRVAAKAGPAKLPLKAFATFEEEIQDALNSGKLSASRQKIAKFMLKALYQHERDANGNIRIKRVAGRALLKIHDEFMGFLELLSESGVSDIVGALL